MLNELKNRQKKFCELIGKGAIAVLTAAKTKALNKDDNYPYQQASDFYYLTGYAEPNVIAVFIPGREEGEYILFNLPRDPEQEVWTGPMIGQEGARKIYGADQAFPLQEADSMLPILMLGKDHLYFDIGIDEEVDAKIIHWLKIAHSYIRTGKNAPDDIINVGKITHEMRLEKSPFEIAVMRKAAEIGTKAHLRAISACKPGMYEYELEAEIAYEYIKGDGRVLAFETIVAGGANACTLHYSKNISQLKDGELVLIDAGVDYEHYTSDITRTFPIGKKFSQAQKAIYQAVLDTQLAVIKIIRPGVSWLTLQETSERVITEKLVELGILKGNPEKLWQKQAFKPFYMHRVSHWLGLDNHDVGKYCIDQKWRALRPNMALSVEPGIYIKKNPSVDKKWWNIGVRIEDDILVTKNGCEVLTKAVPKTIEEIEELRSKAY